jgi:dolichyl-diphosphooligosaccharide--protein glycosyltransferase
VPFVGFQPVKTSEHLGALGVFGIVQLRRIHDFAAGYVSKPEDFAALRRALLMVRCGAREESMACPPCAATAH